MGGWNAFTPELSTSEVCNCRTTFQKPEKPGMQQQLIGGHLISAIDIFIPSDAAFSKGAPAPELPWNAPWFSLTRGISIYRSLYPSCPYLSDAVFPIALLSSISIDIYLTSRYRCSVGRCWLAGCSVLSVCLSVCQHCNRQRRPLSAAIGFRVNCQNCVRWPNRQSRCQSASIRQPCSAMQPQSCTCQRSLFVRIQTEETSPLVAAVALSESPPRLEAGSETPSSGLRAAGRSPSMCVGERKQKTKDRRNCYVSWKMNSAISEW